MPGGFRTFSEWEKTGKYRPRVSFFRTIVLQLEECRKMGFVEGPQTKWAGLERRWRDVKPEDMPGVQFEIYQP